MLSLPESIAFSPPNTEQLLGIPGAVKFEEDYQTIFDKDPDPNIALFYTDLWTAICAIELAFTDTDLPETAEAACSGEPESPPRPCHFTPDEELVLPWGQVQF